MECTHDLYIGVTEIKSTGRASAPLSCSLAIVGLTRLVLRSEVANVIAKIMAGAPRPPLAGARPQQRPWHAKQHCEMALAPVHAPERRANRQCRRGVKVQE